MCSSLRHTALRHAARYAQRGGNSSQDRYYYLKYSFPSFFLHTQFFLVINEYWLVINGYRLIPLGVPADLQSAVKKRPNLFGLCGFVIRIKQDLQTYVVAAAISSAIGSAGTLASTTAALAGSAVVLISLPTSALASITSAWRVLSSTAVVAS